MGLETAHLEGSESSSKMMQNVEIVLDDQNTRKHGIRKLKHSIFWKRSIQVDTKGWFLANSSSKS